MNIRQYRHQNGLVIDEIGSGPRVVLVHGGGVSGAAAWRAQQGWASEFTLVMPHRSAYGSQPLTDREDFAEDARRIADLLGPGSHLIGHSYGGVVALLAAAARPEVVHSLALIEPGATSVARGDPAVDAFERDLAALAAAPPPDPEAHLRALIRVIDPTGELPHPLPPPLVAFSRRLNRLRGTNDVVIPIAALHAAPFPKLVVAGGHSAVFDAVAKHLSARIDAELASFTGLGHVPHWHSDEVNARLLEFLRRAARSVGSRAA